MMYFFCEILFHNMKGCFHYVSRFSVDIYIIVLCFKGSGATCMADANAELCEGVEPVECPGKISLSLIK